MDILLTHGYFLAEDAKEQQVMKPYAPLGLLYLSAYLRKKGLAVEVYDSTFGSFDELRGVLEAERPRLVGVYATLMTRGGALRVIEAAKAIGATVVAGGPEPSNYAREYLDAGADFVVEGEGEVTLEELARAVLDGGSAERVQGVYLRGEDGGAAFTGARPLVAELDSLPWPDRERIPLDKYLAAWRERHGVGSVQLITSRGCPYHCRWCSHSTFGKTHRRRSVSDVADEVERIRDRYAPEMLWFADDVFTIHPGWILDYEKEVARRDVKIPFECITRADRLDEQMADALARLGCFRVWIGSESGSQRILDAMQRGVKVEQVRAAVERCRARGIETGMFLMWGYEGEEIEDIEATIKHVKACLPDQFFTTVAYPIKGTPYYDEVKARLESPAPWARMTERDWKIRGRRSRRFYSFADRLLHAEVERERLPCEGGEDGRSAALAASIAEARRGLREAQDEIEEEVER